MTLDSENRRLFNRIQKRLSRGMNLRQAVDDMARQDRKAGKPALSYDTIYSRIRRAGYALRAGRLTLEPKDDERDAA